jgi:hypothetical protein
MKPASPKDFLAPWEIYPEIPCGSIHWRMGPGEDVMLEWWRNLDPLSKDERMAWLQRHPWPEGWQWWIDRLLEKWN